MKRFARGRKSLKSVEWEVALDINKRVKFLLSKLDLPWIKHQRIFFYRSNFSKTRAYARTWGLPKLWQTSLKVEPAYIVEVISEHFDKLSQKDRDQVLIHELTHIPKTFSGALLPHTRRIKGSFHDRLKKLYEDYHNLR